MKACIECKWFKGVEDYYAAQTQLNRQPECLAPLAASRDPIYGKALCLNERGGLFKKSCGKDGKFWEKKEK